MQQASRTLTVWLFLALGCAPFVSAQDFAGLGEVEAGGTAYYTFVRPGEATIQVLVVGSGGGIYEIGRNTRMDEFLALLGGAPEFATRAQDRRTKVSIQLYRLEGGRRNLLYDERLEDMIMAPADYPRLEAGDIFVVETITRRRISYRTVLQFVTSTSSLLLLLDRLGIIELRR